MTVILILNAVVAAVSIGFALAGATRPATMTHSQNPTQGEKFFSLMYAVRAIPLGGAALITPFLWPGPACAALLWAATAAQLADAAMGLTRREWTMLAGGLIAAAVHATTAIATAAS